MLGSEKTLTCAPCNNDVGFLQRTNSLEDKGRIVGSLKERQSSKNLLACENSEREARFRRTETDFSNLYARGKCFCSSMLPCQPQPGLLLTGELWRKPCVCSLKAALAVLKSFLKCNLLYFRSSSAQLQLFLQGHSRGSSQEERNFVFN